MLNNIKNQLIKYESKIVLILGFILVAVLSFEAGMIKGKNIQQKPLVVNTGTSSVSSNLTISQAAEVSNLPQEAAKKEEGADTASQNCAFLGSKNSNKYHLSSCRWAKQIKQENRVCFSDKNQAELKGYQPDKNCIK